jgi:OmcA/MtrC family decaheme c-type cytochrome
MIRYGGALFFAGVLALAGCSGEDGSPGAPGAPGPTGPTGPTGPDGQDLVATAKPESCEVCHSGAGTAHQAVYNEFTNKSRLTATIDDVVHTANVDSGTGLPTGTYTSTLTFTVKMDGQPYVDMDDPATTTVNETLSGLAQKRFYATEYVSGGFPTATNFQYTASTLAGGTNGVYTVKNTAAKFDPKASATAFIYAYFAAGTPVVEPEGHYTLYPDVYNVGRVFGTVGTIDYLSKTTVEACQRCHPTPYAKHGYRAAIVPGLPPFVACKACHTDQKVGSDQAWQLLVDDPLASALLNDGNPATNPVPAVDWTKYAYTANVMNDTHMSHAMEFAYPQSMANCVTCHEGKLAAILDEDYFTLTTCKSCHPVTAKDPETGLPGANDPKRAPALVELMSTASHDFAAPVTVGGQTQSGLYTATASCLPCHADSSTTKSFSKLHSGYNKVIYADTAGTRYSDAFKVAISDASYNSTTKELTFTVTATETGDIAGLAVTDIKPSVLVSMYGYDTKDFIVGAHVSHSDGERNLEWDVGTLIDTNDDDVGDAPYPRMSEVVPAANGVWQIKADLGEAEPTGLIGTVVKRVEIGVIPTLTKTFTGDTEPTILALDAVTRTFSLTTNAFVDGFYPAIVKVDKCNACHEALGTTFHDADRGGSVVGCRLCHTTLAGGSHLEMQSRSIDSYAHAIHSMQVFDLGDVDAEDGPVWDFTDPVDSMRYTHHVSSVYPNFTILNCESCHEPGMYDVPDNTKSLAGLLSRADTANGWDRNIGAVPAYVTGPGARACGGCHRAQAINADDAGSLVSFNEHTKTFGYLLQGTTDVLRAAIAKVASFFQ